MAFCIDMNRKQISLFSVILSGFLLLASFPADAQGSRVSFNDIRLGTPYKEFVKQLKRQGFKVDKEREEDQLFYGSCKEAFLLGDYDGNPAVVHLTASCKSKTVYEVEVVIREMIDEDEAIEAADRLLDETRARYKHFQYEQPSLNNTLVEMSARGRVTKYLCLPKGGVLLRLYQVPGQDDPKESFGTVTISIYENTLGHEHVVVWRFYDRKAGDQASREAEK